MVYQNDLAMRNTAVEAGGKPTSNRTEIRSRILQNITQYTRPNIQNKLHMNERLIEVNLYAISKLMSPLLGHKLSLWITHKERANPPRGPSAGS
jgi:hypothetical protein